VANKVYGCFWSLVFWWKLNIRACLEGYCEHEV